MSDFSLYLHIPFCKKKCNYCDFTSYAGKENLMDEYLDALKAESGYMSSLYNHPTVQTVYIGGGTPTLLSEDQIKKLFDMIYSDFDVTHNSEISFEANPGTVTKGKLNTFRKLGANRVSLGAQTFNNTHLKKLGRIHHEHEIVSAYHTIRELGFKNVGLDLIFALPGENFRDWQISLEKAVNLNPEHFSTYNLQIEEGTHFFHEKMDGILKTPSEEAEIEMYEYAIKRLTDKGYKHYEISNFSKPGYECRHNTTYWTLENYIGLGTGAHSFIDGTRIENTNDIHHYLTKKFSDIKKEHKNTKKESMSEYIFLKLRLTEGLDLSEFTNKFGVSIRELYRKELSELKFDGLIEIPGKKMKLTQKGIMLANEVFKAFL